MIGAIVAIDGVFILVQDEWTAGLLCGWAFDAGRESERRAEAKYWEGLADATPPREMTPDEAYAHARRYFVGDDR